MYTKGDLIEDFTSGSIYAREILGPDGAVICYVIEAKDAALMQPEGTDADILLKHLNRE